MPEEKDIDWKDSILSKIKEQDEDEQLLVKKLRKKVLKEVSLEDSDKSGKKAFKKTMKTLEEEGLLTIDAEGVVALVEVKSSKKRKKDKKDKKKKKKQKLEDKKEVAEEEEDEKEEAEKEQEAESEAPKVDESQKGIPCDGNPGGVTRLFLGNLPFAVDENSLSDFLPTTVTHIKWITDKETGKFYGSAFVEMDTPSAAAEATAMSTQKLMNRPIKINYAPARPGDIWPPAKKVVLGGAAGNTTTTGGSAGGKGAKAMGDKPENCVKLFIGNLSYDIDDDTITKFFDNVGAELKAVRWLSHKDTGDFKGW